MKETFEDYKKTLEDILINLSYLYSGDVIDSNHVKDYNYTEEKNRGEFSPLFMVNSIKNLYENSFKLFFEKSHKTIIINEKKFNKEIESILSKLNIENVFCGDRSKQYFLTRKLMDPDDIGHLFDKFKCIGWTHDKKIYYNPSINEKETNNPIIYMSDKAIQSLVYIIPNMEYKIVKIDNEKYIHTMEYKLYDCDYKSYRIEIQNIKVKRNLLIDKILNLIKK